MRKTTVLFLIAIYIFASSGVLLELKPAVGNSPSEYRVIQSIPGKLRSRTLTKSSEDIWDANYIIQYDTEDWYYYCPRPCEDTFAVRFVPPVGCTLVAFTWIGYNTQTGVVGAPVGVFVADRNPSVDYSTYPGVEETAGIPETKNIYNAPSPLGDILWSRISTAPADLAWDTVNIDPGIDVGDNTFFCGYSGVNPLDTIACLCESNLYSGNPIDAHTYHYDADHFGPDSGTWFAYYYTSRNEVIQAGIRAYVKCLSPPPPSVKPEKLPWSYNTGSRTVNIYGRDIIKMIIHYSVNDGLWAYDTLNTPISGTVNEGIWQIDIPGANSGDTVYYFVIGKDINGHQHTSETYTYTILEGERGGFLYVKNDDDPSDVLPGRWSDTCYVWDYEVYGAPDSSVLTFYDVIIWRDCGCVALGRGSDYGLGDYDSNFSNVELLHSDSTWIKMVLDNGGRFWLSDQDLGYGLGICPDYGQYGVPQGHWVREYLGIKGMWDDGPLAGGGVTVFGNPADPIIGDMFAGIGYQQAGQLYIYPEQPHIGNFDSIVPPNCNMFTAGGEIVSFRWTGPLDSYKVYIDFYPFDYIVNPTDSTEIDQVTVDSLVEDVLVWFTTIHCFPDNKTLEPDELVKLQLSGIVLTESMIRFYIPNEMSVNLSIYDNTGRLIKILKNGFSPAGLNTVRWDGKDLYGNPVSSGIYFCQLRTEERTVTDKFVVIK